MDRFHILNLLIVCLKLRAWNFLYHSVNCSCIECGGTLVYFRMHTGQSFPFQVHHASFLCAAYRQGISQARYYVDVSESTHNK